jgi:hypothetical protein
MAVSCVRWSHQGKPTAPHDLRGFFDIPKEVLFHVVVPGYIHRSSSYIWWVTVGGFSSVLYLCIWVSKPRSINPSWIA